MSVREAEALVQRLLNPATKTETKAKKPNRDLLRLQDELSEAMGTKVTIKAGNKGAGKLVIEYTSHDHLDEIIAKLK